MNRGKKFDLESVRSMNRDRRSGQKRTGIEELAQADCPPRRDSISPIGWLVYRLQLLNHRGSSRGVATRQEEAAASVIYFASFASRAAYPYFYLVSHRSAPRHPRDLRRRRSSRPAGNSVEYRGAPYAEGLGRPPLFPRLSFARSASSRIPVGPFRFVDRGASYCSLH